ncbi:MAG: metallophosphoesterase [Marinilabiliaceae bacterium]|nr:metallophosphoesterase [Marinilabiliaceae bacterium]
MIVFFIIILSIHILVNLYIYHRGIQGLEGAPKLILSFKIIAITAMLSYPVGRFLEKVWISPLSDIFHWIGAFWFAIMLYSVMLIFASDIIRIINYFIHFLPTQGSSQYINLKLFTTTTIISLTLLIVAIGFYNAWHPKIVNLNIDINKKTIKHNNIKIVAASDIHMGTIIAKRKTRKLVRKINNLNPDIILFAGDVVDEDVQPVIRQNLGESLLELKAPLGIYAVTGNHEYIGGVDRACEYLSNHGLKILRDTSVLIDESFYIVGRDDKDKIRFSNKNRKEISELVDELDKTKPIILLDHQPYNLHKSELAGVDLQISGHTHHGQLWPFGYITQKIFEISKGYKQKGNTHFYVSTGFGTWGPPVRLGNRPEIIVINLTFK